MSGLRALDDNTLLNEYIDLKARAKMIEERLKELQPIILDATLKEDGQKADYMGCELSISYRKQWEYSKELTAMESQVKAGKKFEEATGKATLLGMTPTLTLKISKAYVPSVMDVDEVNP